MPLAAWVGQHVGWRAAFAGIGGLGVMAMAALLLALPRIAGNAEADIRPELKVMTSPAVLLALLATVLGSAAMFTVFTYFAPILQHVMRASPNTVTVTLMIYGVGLTIGNALGGHFADQALTPTLIVVFAALAVLLVLFAWTIHNTVPAIATVFAWGAPRSR